MHGLVLLDAAGEVLRPAILWNDQRTAAECDEIREAVGAERLIEITGNDALTGFTAPKLVWVRDHEPDVWARVAHVLLPEGLRPPAAHRRVRAWTRPTAPARILFDLAARDWSPEVARRPRDRPGVAAADVRGTAGHGHRERDGRGRDRPAGRHAGRGRRRRPGGQRRRRRGHRPGLDGALARHVRRGVRGHGPAASIEPRGQRPRLLPRRPGPLAHDVGDALGGRQPALVPRHARAGRGLRRRSSPRPRRSRRAATACCSCPT